MTCWGEEFVAVVGDEESFPHHHVSSEKKFESALSVVVVVSERQ
jgi:hypothetical protein